MKNCNSVILNGQPLKTDIENRLGYEIRLENDTNCFVPMENHHGAGANARTVFGAKLGTGTGDSIAGEWRHNPATNSVYQGLA